MPHSLHAALGLIKQIASHGEYNQNYMIFILIPSLCKLHYVDSVIKNLQFPKFNQLTMPLNNYNAGDKTFIMEYKKFVVIIGQADRPSIMV